MNKPERVKCKCHCHVDKNVKHVIPCCDNGWIELPVVPAPTVATDNSGEIEQKAIIDFCYVVFRHGAFKSDQCL